MSLQESNIQKILGTQAKLPQNSHSKSRARPEILHTILLVDDDAADRALITKSLLRSPQVREVLAFDCAMALFEHLTQNQVYADENFINAHHPIIFMDAHMPKMSGTDALGQLKGHPHTSDIPVIMLTGDKTGTVAMQAYQQEASAFLHKPLNLDHFHELVDGNLQGCMKSR